MKMLAMLFALFLALPSFAFAKKSAPTTDKTKPTLSSFSVSDSSINEGDSVTIKYKVKDAGGSGLKQVELWKGHSKGNLSPIKTVSASGDSEEGKFTDKPSAGTCYYGIHVVDKAGNVGYDDGAKSVTVKARDTIKPTVSFSVDRSSVNVGDSVTISYKIRDSGGSGLKQVELWKGNSKGNLSPIKTVSASRDSEEGRFTDKPGTGTFYYGIHVVDKAGNVGFDDGAKSVTVKTRDTTKPTLSFTVDRSNISEGDSVTISYKVRDSGGSGLSKVELWKGNSKGNLSQIKTDSVSNDSRDGKFTDKPSAGTFYYGIHVIDEAGNMTTDNGALSVVVMASKASQNPPKVTEVTLKPTSITAGQSALFTATTDRSAKVVILSFTDVGVDVPMSGSGTSWSVNPRINNAGKRPFTVTAYDVNNKAGSAKSGTILVNKQQESTSTTKLPDFKYKAPTYVANPDNRGYCYPQCIEFDKYNLGLPGGRLYAKEYWSSPHVGYVNYPQGSSRAPKPGDILVWSGGLNPNVPKGVCGPTGCGHVAIVKSVDIEKGILIRVDANWDGKCSVMEHQMTTKYNNGGYSIGGSGSDYLLGWQSK